MIETVNSYAKLFAGLTGLTTDDLGFVSENPSSAEAIKAGHSDLERIAAKAQEIFGSGFLNVGLVAACLRDEANYKRNALYETVPVWKPAFVMDNSAIGAFGDAVLKINEAVPDAISAKTIERMIGLPLETNQDDTFEDYEEDEEYEEDTEAIDAGLDDIMSQLQSLLEELG
jgi:hypothetical protein